MNRILDVMSKIRNINYVAIHDVGEVVYTFADKLTDDQLLKEFSWFEVTFNTVEPRIEFHAW